jgi:CheY-like chemotaxis protein
MGIKTVLVVDDHVDTNDILCRFVKAMGHRPVSAFTGEGALALVGTERPDLILLDVMMPGMDGVEVLRMIRGNPQTATVPVIMYSGVADAEFQQHTVAKGANEYWVKAALAGPDLRERLAKYLGAAA